MNKEIIYLPLERLDGRYTAHLDRDILSYLNEQKISYEYVAAPYTKEPEAGMFLNAGQTIQNKMTQLQTLATMYENKTVNNNTIIFISDLWMPGIEAIPYLNHFYKVRPKVRGIVHAGSFTPSDEVAKMWWSRYLEEIIFGLCDKIFVGSWFIKDEIIKAKGKNYEDRVIVTGLPLDIGLERYRPNLWNERENIVVFNGRNHPEKQPELWHELQERLEGHKYEFIWTQEQKLTKVQYYELLCRAKVVVSFALQENFGYGIAEAVALGCLPVVPDRLCYPEQYTDECRYKDIDDCVSKVHWYITSTKQHITRKVSTQFMNPFKYWFNDENIHSGL